jgi:hypothetical protein
MARSSARFNLFLGVCGGVQGADEAPFRAFDPRAREG